MAEAATIKKSASSTRTTRKGVSDPNRDAADAKAKKAKKAKKARKKDGTVGDFGGDVRAFNERPLETADDNETVVASFRSATGHNDGKA